LRWNENRVHALPPYDALAIFLVPTLMLPQRFKIAALLSRQLTRWSTP